MRHRVLATFSGKDRPGITSEITGVLARHRVTIQDIAQAVIQSLLSISIVFELPSVDQSKQVLAELQNLAKDQGLRLEHRALGENDGEPLSSRNLYHYAVTLIADSIGAEALHQVAASLAKRKTNIDTIKRLSEGGFSCVEMIVSSPKSSANAPKTP